MAQEYEQPVDNTASPPPQRMTAAESRAVIDLWQKKRVEQTGLTDRPAVPDVAEGLDITVEDVQRLLTEVRARRLEEERAFTTKQVLSEIRLAEEERKLAEIRRQRAELHREQADADRCRQDAARQAGKWQTEARPKPPFRMPPAEQRYFYESNSGGRRFGYKQGERDMPSYIYAAIILVFVVFVILSNTLK